jgi:hypothetical protein
MKIPCGEIPDCLADSYPARHPQNAPGSSYF